MNGSGSDPCETVMLSPGPVFLDAGASPTTAGGLLPGQPLAETRIGRPYSDRVKSKKNKSFGPRATCVWNFPIAAFSLLTATARSLPRAGIAEDVTGPQGPRPDRLRCKASGCPAPPPFRIFIPTIRTQSNFGQRRILPAEAGLHRRRTPSTSNRRRDSLEFGNTNTQVLPAHLANILAGNRLERPRSSNADRMASCTPVHQRSRPWPDMTAGSPLHRRFNEDITRPQKRRGANRAHLALPRIR